MVLIGEQSSIFINVNIMSNKKEFSKFFVASLKRTAQNVSPLVRQKQKLQAEIAEKQAQVESIQIQLDAFEAPIKEATGGYTTEDLVERVVEVTEKVDKEGKPVKVTKWNLKYPETIIPEQQLQEEVSTEPNSGDAGEEVPGTDNTIID